MTLRNAFSDVVTETTMKRLFNALNVAKDGQDRLLVNGNAGGFEVRGMNWGWHGGYPIRYGSGSPNSVDARDQLAAQTRSNFNNVRTNRWSVT